MGNRTGPVEIGPLGGPQSIRHEARKQDGQYVFRQKDDDPLLSALLLAGAPADDAGTLDIDPLLNVLLELTQII